MITLRSFDTCYGKYLPRLGAVRNDADPLIRCKFYDMVSKMEWYILEGEKVGDNYLFYGYMIGKETVTGQFSFQQLRENGSVNIALFFKPSPLSHIPAFHNSYSHK